MSVIIDGTNGITSPGGDSAAVDIATPKIKTSGNFKIETNGSDRVTVTSAGNVGIGTSSPSEKLDVNGNAAIGSTANAFGEVRFFNSSQNGTTRVRGGGLNLEFILANTERMRIDSSGNLLVGTTIAPSGSDNGTRILGGLVDTSRNTTGSTQHYRFYNPNGQVGSIQTSGSATSYVTSSDYRLKENVAPLTGALEKVQALNPVTWSWKTDGAPGQGFIAHELAEVCPDAVTGEKDAVDEDGNPQYQGVDTSFLVGILTKAIQELNAKVESLQAQLEAK